MCIPEIVHERGPLTVAAFMELALYDPGYGYYARAAQRSGRAGDFFTSVDVGPLFGELVAVQVAEMFDQLAGSPQPHTTNERGWPFDLVEVGAGNGRLSADILRALGSTHPNQLGPLRLHLVEASPLARKAERETLGGLAPAATSSSDRLPASIEGVLLANELIDAFPVHQVVMRPAGLREVYVSAERGPTGTTLRLEEGPLSTPALADYFDTLGMTLQPGWRVEVNLRAIDWITEAAERLIRGFVILIDYGHEACQLYSASHSAGTLTSFTEHRASNAADAARAETPTWLGAPGEQDLTSHVDFTTLRFAAEAAGLTTLAFLDQTYFLLGLLETAMRREAPTGTEPEWVRTQRRQLQTLIMPGGLGSTHKVLILGKHVGSPRLAGGSFSMRVT